MIKRLALFCCILLLPAIAAAEGTTNYGDFWVGGQVGGVFTLSRTAEVPARPPVFQRSVNIDTDAAFSAGAIVGYNFCMPYRQIWERYFGLALDFQWNQFSQSIDNFSGRSGNQYALGFLARAQYPLMGDENFTRGKWVPFIMAGPAIVWTSSNFSAFGGGTKTSTDVGVLVELGLEYFIIPQLSIGPSFRYRHVFGSNQNFDNVTINQHLDQFMVLGRLAYHF